MIDTDIGIDIDIDIGADGPAGPTALAGPDAGLRLTRVVLGRGTQNYTCIDSLETTIPTGGGAVAALYDASCLAATFPALLHELPNALVALSSGTARQRITRDAALVGHHFFAPNFATPVFDFRTKPGQTGIFTGARDAGIPAAAGAARGGPPDQQFGAVDWLRLKTLPGQSVGYQLVYRIHTAGGKPPPNCKGRPSTITIEYATEYCEDPLPPSPFPVLPCLAGC